LAATFLCFDLGTTKTKSSLINENGTTIYMSENLVKTYSHEYKYQNPDDYFNIVHDEIKRIKKQHPKKFKDAACLICTGQMAGILGIDQNWDVIFPWTFSVDTNYIDYLYKLEAEAGEDIRKLCGGVPTGTAKILWIKNEKPMDYKKIDKFINLTTYVAGKLCGLGAKEAFIDFSCLTMNGLADIREGAWNSTLAEKLEIDMSKLPVIKRPFECIGRINKYIFDTNRDIEVLAGCGDQIAGFIGAGVINKNDIIDVAGTYSVLGYCTDRFLDDSKKKVLSTIYSGISDIYYQVSVINATGHTYDWFRKRFDYTPDDKADSLGLFFVPHIGGRYNPPQPYFDGAWVGLNWDHCLDHFFVSILESIGYEFGYALDYIKILNKLKKDVFSTIKVIGGGAKNNLWNEIKSSILNIKYIKMTQIPYEIRGGFLISRCKNDIRKYKKYLAYNKELVEGMVYPDSKKVDSYSKSKEDYIFIIDKMAEIFQRLKLQKKA